MADKQLMEVTIERADGRDPLVLQLEDSVSVEPITVAQRFMALFKAGDYVRADELLLNWGILIGKRLTEESAQKLAKLDLEDPLSYMDQVNFLLEWYKGAKPFLTERRKLLLNSELLAP